MGDHQWTHPSPRDPRRDPGDTARLADQQGDGATKLVLALDSGEVFAQSGVTPGFPRGTTARGGAILHWMAEHSLPLRLDYLAARQELVKIETEPFLIMNRSWESFLFPNPRTVAPAPPTTTARQMGGLRDEPPAQSNHTLKMVRTA